LDEGQALKQVSDPAGQGLEGGVGLGSPHLGHLGQTQWQLLNVMSVHQWQTGCAV
jgi:hypothetical protein